MTGPLDNLPRATAGNPDGRGGGAGGVRPAPSERVELTETEREALREWYFGDQYDDHGLIAAVESILSARLAQVQAERDEWESRWRNQRETYHRLWFDGQSVRDWHAEHCTAAEAASKAEAERDRWKAAWDMAEPVLTERDRLARKVDDLVAINVETTQERDRLGKVLADVRGSYDHAYDIGHDDYETGYRHRERQVRAVLDAAGEGEA